MVWVPQYLSNASSEVFQWTFRLEFIVHDPGMRNMRRNFFANTGSNVKLFMSNLRTFTNIHQSRFTNIYQSRFTNIYQSRFTNIYQSRFTNI